MVILDLLEFFILKKTKPEAKINPVNREMLISLCAYLALSKINPETDKKIEFLFWGFFFFEMGLQVFIIRKFRQPLQFRPFSVYFSNHILNISFAAAILFSVNLTVFYFVFGLLFIANAESIAIVYFLPFWKDDIKWIGDALLVKKNFEKYLRR